jgi:hypothetical protein
MREQAAYRLETTEGDYGAVDSEANANAYTSAYGSPEVAAADTDANTSARSVITGAGPVRRYWLATIAIIVRLGGNAARETGR